MRQGVLRFVGVGILLLMLANAAWGRMVLVATGEDDMGEAIFVYKPGAAAATALYPGYAEELDGAAFGPGGNAYIAFNTLGYGFIDRFDPQTGAVSGFKNTIDGLTVPMGLTFGPDSRLYAMAWGLGLSPSGVLRYNATTGELIDTFIPGGSGGLTAPYKAVFAGNTLYVSDYGKAIRKYSAADGSSFGDLAIDGDGGLAFPSGITLGPDGALYVADRDQNEVLRFDPTTGASLGTFIPAGSGGLDFPTDLTFGPDGDLYVASSRSNGILQYDGTTGQYIQNVNPPGPNQIFAPRFLTIADLPEPCTPAILLLMGAAGLGRRKRRRNEMTIRWAWSTRAAAFTRFQIHG